MTKVSNFPGRIDLPAIKDSKVSRLDDKIDLGQEILKIHNYRKSQVMSSDIVLARFQSEKDKQYIIEMEFAAFFYLHCETNKLAIQKKSREWQGIPLSINQIQEVVALIQKTYELMMNSIATLSIVNRNVEQNHLVSLIMESQQPVPEVIDTQGDTRMKQIMEKFRNQETEQLPPR